MSLGELGAGGRIGAAMELEGAPRGLPERRVGAGDERDGAVLAQGAGPADEGRGEDEARGSGGDPGEEGHRARDDGAHRGPRDDGREGDAGRRRERPTDHRDGDRALAEGGDAALEGFSSRRALVYGGHFAKHISHARRRPPSRPVR